MSLCRLRLGWLNQVCIQCNYTYEMLIELYIDLMSNIHRLKLINRAGLSQHSISPTHILRKKLPTRVRACAHVRLALGLQERQDVALADLANRLRLEGALFHNPVTRSPPQEPPFSSCLHAEGVRYSCALFDGLARNSGCFPFRVRATMCAHTAYVAYCAGERRRQPQRRRATLGARAGDSPCERRSLGASSALRVGVGGGRKVNREREPERRESHQRVGGSRLSG